MPRPIRYQRPLSIQPRRESIYPKVIAAGLGIVLGAGGLALGQKAWQQDPNELTPCEDNWQIESISTENRVTHMPEALAALELGRSELVSLIHDEIGTTGNAIKVSSVSAQYRAAAELLIGKTNDYWYDTSETELDTPREQFCEDPQAFGIYKTPDYVRAEAALLAAGIDIQAGQEQ